MATSQYVPAGKDVANVRLSVAPSRLKTAYAFVPRPKAIWLPPLDHQFVTAVPYAALWNPTRLAVVRHRCSQAHPEEQLTAVVVPFEEAGGPASGPASLYATAAA